MRSILETCIPKQNLVQGTFNLEVFTAGLGPVIDYYKKGSNNSIDSIYTDAKQFFTEGTYVTDGLKTTVNNIFKRISGDMNVPALNRLETAFGGGKTHTLIACVHIANRGKAIAPYVKEIIDDRYLPDSGSVKVVGIAGDELPLSKTVAGQVQPYTLWGEIARQIGGEELYESVKKDVETYAAPGRDYFDKVFGNRRILIMIDELAQYAARLKFFNGSESQIPAFIMTMNGYVRSNPGIAVVLTLAGSNDAFAKETEKLGRVLDKISTEKLSQDDIVNAAAEVANGLRSVLMRDATGITPVLANEISAVLGKRLFDRIDYNAASDTAKEYADAYEKNRGMLPQEATSINFKDRMISCYPFHPTLIDFLNNKLAQSENFQGTRGVLRTLALTVKSIWENRKNVGMIHVSDIDMYNDTVVNEILGRTGSSDLKAVLNTDVGSSDTVKDLKSGKSNAQFEDANNPHPDGILMFENVWKIVFLNSLVGRSEGFASNVFGLTEQEAIFQSSTPLLTPPQVRIALDKIKDSAYYLRFEHGKYFAHLEPTLNSVLSRIRDTIDHGKIVSKLRAVANTLVTETGIFQVVPGVEVTDDVPDNFDKPVVAVVALDVEKIDVKLFYERKANGQFRIRKNLLTLLVPKTVRIDGLDSAGFEDGTLFNAFAPADDSIKDLERAEYLARQVLAINILSEHPEQYGIKAEKLQEPEFRARKMSRPQELNTAVAGLYNSFCYWSRTGVIRKDIKNAGGDSGETIINMIQAKLIEDGELILMPNSGRFGAAALKDLSDNYFFNKVNTYVCKNLLESFYNTGTWPLIANKDVLDRMLREGVESGLWVIYKDWIDISASRPSEIYSDKKPVALSVDLLNGEYKLTTSAYAKKNGWLDSDKPTDEKVKDTIKDVMRSNGDATVRDVIDQVKNILPKADEEQVKDTIKRIASEASGGVSIFEGSVGQEEKPEEDKIFEGLSVPAHDLKDDDVVITRKEQAQRGWFNNVADELKVEGGIGDKNVAEAFKLFGKLGSMYTRGKAKSPVKSLDFYNLKLPGGGTMRITFDNADEKDFKILSETFADLSSKLRVISDTGFEIVIEKPDDKCELVKALKELKN